MKHKKIFIAIYLCCISSVFAELKLPSVFSDNMVLQQQSNVLIWGWSKPNQKVRCEVSWLGNAIFTRSDENGKWNVKVKTPKAGHDTYEITISDSENTITIHNVLAGEVWLCSGQSNMKMRVVDSANAEQEIANANYPSIRIFDVPKVVADTPQSNCKADWKKCSSETIENFTAAGYFFGRELHKKLDVPIGLISSAWGGTRIEAWTAMEVLKANSDNQELLKKLEQSKQDPNYSQKIKEYHQRFSEWWKIAEQARKQGLPYPPGMPREPFGPQSSNAPAGLYNGMISPLIPYGIRGVIWYQGESNAWNDGPDKYRKQFPEMIQSWRAKWEQGVFPFYYVQIAPWLQYGKKTWAAKLREAQLMTLSVPNTGMVVTTDMVDDLNEIHPKNKQDIGKRLALWALSQTYGQNDIVYSGPLYRSMKIEGNTIRIFFEHACNGLSVKDGDKLTNFTIAGNDKNFVEAQAVIDGDTITVSSTKVKKPVAVRFAWESAPTPNLFNKNGLPASPFRTDRW